MFITLVYIHSKLGLKFNINNFFITRVYTHSKLALKFTINNAIYNSGIYT